MLRQSNAFLAASLSAAIAATIGLCGLLLASMAIYSTVSYDVVLRTREVGIRMAIGARRRNVLIQFLMEALIISLAGSLIGVGIGIGCAWLVAEFVGMPVVVTLWSIIISFSVAAAVGIFFGFYPARNAAQLRPIEALLYH